VSRLREVVILLLGGAHAPATLPWPQSGEMFIDRLPKKGCFAPEERNVFLPAKCLAPPELGSWSEPSWSINIWSRWDRKPPPTALVNPTVISSMFH